MQFKNIHIFVVGLNSRTNESDLIDHGNIYGKMDNLQLSYGQGGQGCTMDKSCELFPSDRWTVGSPSLTAKGLFLSFPFLTLTE